MQLSNPGFLEGVEKGGVCSSVVSMELLLEPDPQEDPKVDPQF